MFFIWFISVNCVNGWVILVPGKPESEEQIQHDTDSRRAQISICSRKWIWVQCNSGVWKVRNWRNHLSFLRGVKKLWFFNSTSMLLPHGNLTIILQVQNLVSTKTKVPTLTYNLVRIKWACGWKWAPLEKIVWSNIWTWFLYMSGDSYSRGQKYPDAMTTLYVN